MIRNRDGVTAQVAPVRGGNRLPKVATEHRIDVPDFFEPLISVKLALHHQGRADEKEPIH